LTKGDKPKEQTHAWGHFIQRHLPPGPWNILCPPLSPFCVPGRNWKSLMLVKVNTTRRNNLIKHHV